MMKAIVWADGARVTGKTWQAVEDAMRQDDFQSEGRLTPMKYRKELCERAAVWADLDGMPEHRGSSEEFLRRMQDYGMLQVIEEGESAPTQIRKGASVTTRADMFDGAVSVARNQTHSVRI
jgi:hypothetical protein